MLCIERSSAFDQIIPRRLGILARPILIKQLSTHANEKPY
ncbi:hypothetical protein AM1_5744 [Acaryochloris marina MBIC11017]|uniref:Uncharacterized protein n=1 Tax=Acaryochloris marina (strain MBIC 11017) TaxID=329726 RepID=B0BZE4_ACAM1|nr:hypothetical protein AM1_5744 [Acaryochloris marina MBIC11017]